MTDSALLQQAEELITAGDPYGFAVMIVQRKFTEISEDELRELLARAFVTAGRNERQESAGEGNGSLLLDTMALDLRYNPGKLSLLGQIYIFYPKLKNANLY